MFAPLTNEQRGKPVPADIKMQFVTGPKPGGAVTVFFQARAHGVSIFFNESSTLSGTCFSMAVSVFGGRTSPFPDFFCGFSRAYRR
jgi:hypothetical protein